MPRTASYDELLIEMLKDEDRALAYLNAALDEPDPRLFLIALRNVTQAQGGVGKIAKLSGLNRESLYRALSQKGNPGVQTLAAILGALGARLAVGRIERDRRPVRVRQPLGSFTLMSKVGPVVCWPNSRVVAGVQLAAA
jgi:probable addiction module antidote protein